MTNGLNSDDNGQLPILRVRHMFEFDTPIHLKRSEEITFYNGEIEPLNEIVIDVREFLPYLNVYDSDGKKLIFHSYLEEYLDFQAIQNENESMHENGNNDKDFNFPIIIEFPRENPVLSREYRTITLNYIKQIEFQKGFIALITVPLDNANHFYLHVKKLSQYKTDIRYLLLSDENNYFRIDDLEEIDYVETEDTVSFSSFSSNIPIDNCQLVIGVWINLQSWDKRWFDGGIAIASIAIIINLLLGLLDLKNNLTSIIAICSIVNTYLIITKGWIFMKDIDSFMKLPYTNIYLFLILLIFSELLISIIISTYNFDFIQNIYIVVDQQIKMNITL